LPAPNKSSKGFVGILSVELHFPESGSLKAKRVFLRRVRDTVTRRYGASFAEVSYQDLWQRSRIVIAVAASDLAVLDASLDRLVVYLDSQEWVVSGCERELVEIDA
jgi:uncharacterized protein